MPKLFRFFFININANEVRYEINIYANEVKYYDLGQILC